MNRNDRMGIMNTAWNIYVLYIIISIFMVLAGIMYPHSNEAFNSGSFETVDKNIVMTDPAGKRVSIRLPYFVAVKKSEAIELQIRLPEDVMNGQYMFIYTGHLNTKVYIDGVCRGIYMGASTYSSGVKMPAEWYAIRLDENDAGSDLRVVMEAGKSSYMGWLDRIYTGDKLAIIYHFILANIFPIIVAVILFVMSIVVIVTYISLKKRGKSDRYIYIGISMLMMSLQLFMHSPVRQVYMQNMLYAGYADRILMLLSYVPLILFFIETGKEHGRPVMKYGMTAFFAGATVDSFARYVLKTNIMYWSYILGILIMYICFMYIYVQQMIREGREQREAYMLNETKTQFLADMSHAIRTPINAIMGMDTMILRDGHESRIREYATDIKNAVATLLSIIDDVLDFSKIESGKLEINPMEYDLSSLIYDCYNMTIMRASEKGLALKVNNDRNIPNRLFGDEIRIRQIIINILTNAAKYTHEGTISFNVGYKQHEDEEDMIDLIIDVKDTGIGIKEENIGKLFMSYERLDETKNRGIEGTGLGLSITKELVSRMDGTITVESEYGKGSEFTVVLPQRVLEKEVIGDYAERIEQLRDSTSEQLSWFYAPKARILVVDDVDMNLKVMQALFAASHMQVDTAKSGFDCLDMVKKHSYDIIFMDHMMPGMDGIETFSKMKEIQDGSNTDTPVIMLTANAVMGAKEKYISGGFNDYLSKPVEERELIATCRKFLQAGKIEVMPENASEVQENSDASDSNDRIIESIGGLLNVSEGMMYCMEKKDFYIDMIRDFMASERMNMVKDSYVKKDINSYRINVHALKSSAHMLGADEISEQAKQLEAAAAEGDQAFIDANHSKLVHDTDVLVEALMKIMQSDDSKEEPTEDIAEDEFKALLNRIYRCADDFDIDGAEKALKRIREYRLPKDAEEGIGVIEKAVNNIDYDDVKDEAEKMLQTHGGVE